MSSSSIFSGSNKRLSNIENSPVLFRSLRITASNFLDMIELPAKGIIATLNGSSDPLVISKNNSLAQNMGKINIARRDIFFMTD